MDDRRLSPITRWPALAVLVLVVSFSPAGATGGEAFHAHGTYLGIPMTLSADAHDLIIRYCHDPFVEGGRGVYRIPYEQLLVIGEPTGYRVEFHSAEGWNYWTAHYTHGGVLIAGFGSDWGLPMMAVGGTPPPCSI